MDGRKAVMRKEGKAPRNDWLNWVTDWMSNWMICWKSVSQSYQNGKMRVRKAGFWVLALSEISCTI